MLVTQISNLINLITSEYTDFTAILNEDLSNVVELGDEIENKIGYDNYVRSLADHIGRMIFVNRKYSGRAPSVMMDGWEYGSILEKVSMKNLPTATENESWELTDGASYDPNIFYKPEVSAKFWNKRITFEIPISITYKQVKSSFSNGTQLNAFISMIYTAIDNSMTVKYDALIMRTINNFIAETINADYGSTALNEKSGMRAINLLYLYNAMHSSALQPAEAVTDPEFIRFAVYTMTNYIDQLKVLGSRYNVGGADRFTPAEDMHVVMLSEFRNAANAFLQSNTFHEQYTALPNADSVPFWQGTGTDNTFLSHSKIDVKAASGATVSASGILAVLFDRNALGVTNLDRRVTSNWNPKGEFWNYWHKFDAGYFNDLDENGIVFFVA